ncbi:hypothetical protein BDV25DRAFT_145325 [Aspergillus avenaceus]|uniref:Uncharacterized protein n=1 Tax=Aspergillus avenaceus TaxID=36643 RepID=A0A5N6TER2_ASPAV|nr:hypothetical protein BDV25DRAFT_145325 [Aspergillus avenaceus]
MLAAQTVLPREDVAIGASLMFFGQQLFGTVFTSVGQNVLDYQLLTRLSSIPDIDLSILQHSGATQFLDHVPAQFRFTVRVAYNNSLCVCFRFDLIMACISFTGAVTMEWRTVRKKVPGPRVGERAAEEGKCLGGVK